MYNNCGIHYHSIIRMAFFQLLSEYKHIDAVGKCMHNMGTKDKANEERFKEHKRDSGDTFYDLAADRYREYKFVISFENSAIPGYFTEKLLNPVLAGSIPVSGSISSVGWTNQERATGNS